MDNITEISRYGLFENRALKNMISSYITNGDASEEMIEEYNTAMVNSLENKRKLYKLEVEKKKREKITANKERWGYSIYETLKVVLLVVVIQFCIIYSVYQLKCSKF